MKILLVKLSSLGDVVHTLPVVQDILAARPDAQIDWVVESAFAPLLKRCSGLHRIITCSLRRWRKAPLAASTRREWHAFRQELQQEAYDAVIDLQGLTKSALVARLATLAPGGQRFAMANQTDGSGYEAPTRWLANVAITLPARSHAVQRGRALVSQALTFQPLALPDFGLRVSSPAETTAAIETAKRSVVLVHGTSRADKEWPLAHWVAFGQQLHQVGLQVALVHGSPSEQATSEAMAQKINALTGQSSAAVMPLMALDALTDCLAASRGVVGVDSGVSHIAVALGLPHVQIYNVETAWRTGPLPAQSPRQVSVFAWPTPAVATVWQAFHACLEAAA